MYKIENSWKVSSKDSSILDQKKRDLSNLAGQWNSQIHVVISNPTSIQQGPIEQRSDRR